MNSNSSKQVVLSIVGVAILVVAIVGVSFAFFTYTRTGGQNNLINTGRLTFAFEDGVSTINLTNQFPMSDANGLKLSGTSNVCNFKIKGTTTSVINYTVYGVQGDAISGRNRLRDYEVKIKLTGSTSGTVPASECISIKNNYNASYGAIVSSTANALKTTDSLVLATGDISSHDSGVAEVHTYTLNMWIPNSVVSVGETTSTANGKTTYSSADFEKLYYSMKINVRAADAAGSTGQ